MVTILLISAPRRQRQGDLCEFEANLVYTVSSKPEQLLSETLSQGMCGGGKQGRKRKEMGEKSKENFKFENLAKMHPWLE